MQNFKNQKLLVIAPHPDDEVIGAGGFIKKIKNHGGKVYVLILTVGDTTDFSKEGASKKSLRLNELEKVAKYLAFDDYHVAYESNEYHLNLDTIGRKKLIHVIERESPVSIEKIKPTIIAFPSLTSYNQDHAIVALAAHAALRPAELATKHFVETVLSYEQAADNWNLHKRYEPNYLVTLSKEEIAAKITAMGFYKSQTRPAPNLRSETLLKTLAVLRGALAGSDFAEGYHSLRTVV